MGYNKEITQLIVEAWGRGATAQRTVAAIEKSRGIKIGLATVYRHRHSLTAQDLVEELKRQQLEGINQSDNEEVKLRYRNELLKILIPQITLNLNKNITETENTVKHVIEFVDPDNPAETYPPSEVQAARRAGIISPIESKISSTELR